MTIAHNNAKSSRTVIDIFYPYLALTQKSFSKKKETFKLQDVN